MSTDIEPSNGGAELLPPPDYSNYYPADADTQQVEVATSGDKARAVITHLFSPLRLEHLKKYAEDAASTVEFAARTNKQKEVPNLEIPDVNLFDALTQGAVVRILGERPREIEVPRERALEMTAEEKAKAVERLFRCHVEVETSIEEEGIDFLFEGEGTMRVRFLVGDEDKPAYTLHFQMKRPEGSKRKQFREDFIKQDRQRKGGKVRVTTSTDYAKAAGFFDKHFESVEGVLVEGQPYVPEVREKFLAAFSPAFKSEIAGGLVNSFSRDESDF